MRDFWPSSNLQQALPSTPTVPTRGLGQGTGTGLQSLTRPFESTPALAPHRRRRPTRSGPRASRCCWSGRAGQWQQRECVPARHPAHRSQPSRRLSDPVTQPTTTICPAPAMTSPIRDHPLCPEHSWALTTKHRRHRVHRVARRRAPRRAGCWAHARCSPCRRPGTWQHGRKPRQHGRQRRRGARLCPTGSANEARALELSPPGIERPVVGLILADGHLLPLEVALPAVSVFSANRLRVMLTLPPRC